MEIYHRELSECLEAYDELISKSIVYYRKHPEIISRLNLFRQRITDLNLDICAEIINLDREIFNLTEDEKKRIEEDEKRDRITERVIPFLLLSSMIEDLNHSKNI